MKTAKLLMYKNVNFGDNGEFDGDFIGKPIGTSLTDVGIEALKEQWMQENDFETIEDATMAGIEFGVIDISVFEETP